jgi:transposase
MEKRYCVNLTEEEQNYLATFLTGGTQKVREIKRAQILLKANDGWSDAKIAEALSVGKATVGRIRKRYAQQGLAAALHDKKRNRIYERKMDGEAEAHLIALATSPPPSGHKRWTLRLLAKRLVELEEVPFDSISHETIRLTLKKTNLSLGNEKNG